MKSGEAALPGGAWVPPVWSASRQHQAPPTHHDTRCAEAGAAAVQLTADGSLVKVSLDEVAEYAGPEHDDE